MIKQLPPQEIEADNRGLDDLRSELRRVADSDRIPALRRALQVERGGYGEGDTIIGVNRRHVRAGDRGRVPRRSTA
jgi:hypothetical protein